MSVETSSITDSNIKKTIDLNNNEYNHNDVNHSNVNARTNRYGEDK